MCWDHMSSPMFSILMRLGPEYAEVAIPHPLASHRVGPPAVHPLEPGPAPRPPPWSPAGAWHARCGPPAAGPPHPAPRVRRDVGSHRGLQRGGQHPAQSLPGQRPGPRASFLRSLGKVRRALLQVPHPQLRVTFRWHMAVGLPGWLSLARVACNPWPARFRQFRAREPGAVRRAAAGLSSRSRSCRWLR